jgi:hypothetical protein
MPIAPHPGRLGRRQATDPRDRCFLLPRPLKLPSATKKIWADGGQAWDQGETSECVAYSSNRFLIASPVRQRPWPAGIDAFYAECQKLDEWASSPHDGTSVRAAFKVLQAAGYVSEYRWAFDVPTIVSQILTVGPVVAGTDWCNPMFDVDPHGFVHVSATGRDYDVAGGHAYLLIGVDRKKKCPDGTVGAFLFQNSWGEGWGKNGQAWISLADFTLLLNHQGEAAVAAEVKVA